MKAKKKRHITHYQKQLLGLMDEYARETGNKEVDPRMAAKWAVRKKKWEAPEEDLIGQLAHDMRSAARQDFIEDENGEPVRRRHPYKIKQGEKQHTFWFKIEECTPQKMRLSAQWKRRGILSVCLQTSRDLNFFNKNYNPGDPVQISFNFEPDMAEHQQPSEYVDSPPPAEEGEEDQ